MINSIRGRVLFLVLAAQLLAVSGAVGLAIAYVHRALWASFYSELQARTISVLALVDEADDRPGRVSFDTQQAIIPPGDLFYIADANGQPVAGSSSWIEATDERRQSVGRRWKFHHGSSSFRGNAMIDTTILDQDNHQVPPIHVSVYYAMPADRTLAQMVNATRIVIAVGILSLILSAGSTWLAVGRGMRPLTDFAVQADRIEADGAPFEQSVGHVHSAELLPLARALHRLVDRIQAAFQRERCFLSDAAHELKTAVAIQKSTLQLLEQGVLSERDYREGIGRALEDTARTERLVADMLLLSSIEQAQRAGGVDGVCPPVRLNDSLLTAIDQLAPVAQMNSVAIAFQPALNLLVDARESELNQLWVNLIENAIQHSPNGSKVVIETGLNGTHCRVRIEDRGSGIPSHDLSHVFERFYRSDSSRSRLTGGFGLGLSIARAVVEKNRGTIEIQSVPAEGTTVEVQLPAHPVDAA